MSRVEQKMESFSMPIPEAGCHVWIGARDPRGYGRVRYGGKACLAHRVSWECVNGPVPAGLCVLHKCDTPACINPDHLSLGTHQENMADRDRKGRGNQARGETHYRAKLTDDQVRLIRASVEPASSLARRYGVSCQHVNFIKTGKRRGAVA